MALEHAYRFATNLVYCSQEHRNKCSANTPANAIPQSRSFRFSSIRTYDYEYGHIAGIDFDCGFYIPSSAGNLSNASLIVDSVTDFGTMYPPSPRDTGLFQRPDQVQKEKVIRKVQKSASVTDSSLQVRGYVFYINVSWHTLLGAYRDGYLDVDPMLAESIYLDPVSIVFPKHYLSNTPLPDRKTNTIPFITPDDRSFGDAITEYLLSRTDSLELQALWHGGNVTTDLVKMSGSLSYNSKGSQLGEESYQIQLQNTAWGSQYRTVKQIHYLRGRVRKGVLLAVTAMP